jgi:hypothetical protein
MCSAVTTRSFDGSRSGSHLRETVLTPQAVRSRGVRKVLTLRTPDDPRLEAQPLYLSGLEIRGKKHDVVIQATMGNHVYAWDADSGEQLWDTFLGHPVKGTIDIDAHLVNVQWGMLSTPVIDGQHHLLYGCFWTSPNGDWRDGAHRVVALDILTGNRVHQDIDLENVSFDARGALRKLSFKSMERKQRAGLALSEGVVFIAFGTIAETGGDARGWLIAVDVDKWSISAAWCSTQRGTGGGIWMSGSAPAVQSDGSIWIVTGNGDFDGTHDFAESVVRLRYERGASDGKGNFEVTGWWTPYTDDGRTGGDPGGEAVATVLPERRPSNFRIGPHLARLGMAVTGEGWSDQDLGASGVVLIEERGVALVSGKDGILYTIRLDHPGNTKHGDLEPSGVKANFAKLAARPILYTYFDPGMNPAPTNAAHLNRFAANRTHHLHGTPVVWKSKGRGWTHFCGGENGNVRAWSLRDDHSSAYLACSEAVASPNSPVPSGGMPGWSLALSANVQEDGVVWAMMPYDDANMHVTNGRLIAYDAQDFDRFGDGSGEILPLWDSQQWNWNFLHPKFNRPIVADGRVIVPTYGGEVLIVKLA